MGRQAVPDGKASAAKPVSGAWEAAHFTQNSPAREAGGLLRCLAAGSGLSLPLQNEVSKIVLKNQKTVTE